MSAIPPIRDLTPEQQERLFKVMLEHIVSDSMNDGIRAAATMVRLSPVSLSRNELADLIEKTTHD